MTQLISLKCPNCGAPYSSKQSRCEYCGIELILVDNDSSVIPKEKASCSKCGGATGTSAWFCAKCEYVEPEKKEIVRWMQTRFRFLQDDLRESVPHLTERPGDDPIDALV